MAEAPEEQKLHFDASRTSGFSKAVWVVSKLEDGGVVEVQSTDIQPIEYFENGYGIFHGARFVINIDSEDTLVISDTHYGSGKSIRTIERAESGLDPDAAQHVEGNCWRCAGYSGYSMGTRSS